ncbi:hypothetical protein Tsp_15774, partial [Trichinella spiralis]|uniref:hypothetical protein n=1 Tax=Trichinella spiralis TaxID=6334 RepID=UPI0001EFD2DB
MALDKFNHIHLRCFVCVSQLYIFLVDADRNHSEPVQQNADAADRLTESRSPFDVYSAANFARRTQFVTALLSAPRQKNVTNGGKCQSVQDHRAAGDVDRGQHHWYISDLPNSVRST